jgi:hypothetical protein
MRPAREGQHTKVASAMDVPDLLAGRWVIPDVEHLKMALHLHATIDADPELAETIARRAFELEAWDLLPDGLAKFTACGRYQATTRWAQMEMRCERCRWVKEAHPQYTRKRLLALRDRLQEGGQLRL